MTTSGTVAGVSQNEPDNLERAAPDEAEAARKKAENASANRWAVGIVLAVLVVAGLCGLKISSKDSPEDPSGDAKRVCQEEFIPKRLKAPKTAEFSGVTVTETAGTYTVTGSVDAQNTFGALVRSSFTCVVHSSGDNWVLDTASVS